MPSIFSRIQWVGIQTGRQISDYIFFPEPILTVLCHL